MTLTISDDRLTVTIDTPRASMVVRCKEVPTWAQVEQWLAFAEQHLVGGRLP